MAVTDIERKLPAHAHIIGAGGVGMSGLALLLQRMGVRLTASDKNDSPYLQSLSGMGIETWVGSAPLRIHPAAEVFYSSAVKADDVERQFVSAKGLRAESRHALLSLITREYFTIAIAGCHGKTTTSAWVADLLMRANLDPTALIGGTVPQWNSNYRAGKGVLAGKPILVIEADESDRSFLAIQAQVAMVTNIDLDHTDIHESLASLTHDFSAFARGAIENGGALYCSKECSEDVAHIMLANDAALRAEIQIHADKHALAYAGKFFPVRLAGIHNLQNATLVLQLGLALGLEFAAIAAALAEFSGVNRRMQKLAEFAAQQLTVIDDYAHHPHEVQATLSALQTQYEHLIIFWEPHRLSRFTHFHAEFMATLSAFAAGNTLVSLPLYASGDKAEDYPQAAQLFQTFQKPPFQYLASTADFATIDLQLGARKNAAVFMGAGLSSEYAQAFVDFMRR